MRLLFIPRDPGQFQSSLWRTLEEFAEVDTLELERPADALGRHTGPATLDECLALARRLEPERYDYIVGHANSLLWMSVFRLAGIATPFAIVPNYNHVQDYTAYALALASQLRVPGDVLFTGSRAAQQAFERFGFRCLPHHAPGVPVDTFRLGGGDPIAARQRLGIPADVPVLLYTGRLQPDKRIDALIAAHHLVRKERPAHLVIAYHIWDERYEAYCRALADRVGQVTFVKDPPTAELGALYRLADLFVLFGVSEFETFGRSPVEAMACGAVPLVPRYDGFVDNVPASAGVLVRTHGDIANRSCAIPEFAQEIVTLLEAPARLATMSESCVSWVQRFDHSVCLERFVQVLARTTSRATTTRSTWSNADLPAEVRAMSGELEGRQLGRLLGEFLATKTPRLAGWDENQMAYRRMWFASFFPESC
jgi:glycosyltransferase involved in cell wall biosynthesis